MLNIIGSRWFQFMVVMVFIINSIGCAGSKSHTVGMQISSSTNGPICLMPYNTNFERNYYSDIRQREKSILDQIIVHEIQKRSNAFTYTFDDTDLKNLRTTILHSLNKSNQFTFVKDVRALEDNLPNNGVRLFVDFKRMGVTQKFAFICMIEAHLKVESHDGNILKERAISISEKGIMTLSAAKNKAIKKFIKELEGLLNEI